MSVDNTWLAVDERDRVLVMSSGKHGAYPHETPLLEDYAAEEQAALRGQLGLHLPPDQQAAWHLRHTKGEKPDVFERDGGRGGLTLADLPPAARAHAARYRLPLGDAASVQLRSRVSLEAFTAWTWGEASGIHPLDASKVDALPSLPGWPKHDLESRLLALYGAVLIQAIACNAHEV